MLAVFGCWRWTQRKEKSTDKHSVWRTVAKPTGNLANCQKRQNFARSNQNTLWCRYSWSCCSDWTSIEYRKCVRSRYFFLFFFWGFRLKNLLDHKDTRFNSAIDKKTGYKTKSILCLPILNELGECVAVAQAINKLNDNDDDIISFTSKDEEVWNESN